MSRYLGISWTWLSGGLLYGHSSRKCRPWLRISLHWLRTLGCMCSPLRPTLHFWEPWRSRLLIDAAEKWKASASSPGSSLTTVLQCEVEETSLIYIYACSAFWLSDLLSGLLVRDHSSLVTQASIRKFPQRTTAGHAWVSNLAFVECFCRLFAVIRENLDLLRGQQRKYNNKWKDIYDFMATFKLQPLSKLD